MENYKVLFHRTLVVPKEGHSYIENEQPCIHDTVNRLYDYPPLLANNCAEKQHLHNSFVTGC